MNKDDELTVKIKMDYKTEKSLKKFYGMYLGREIATTRRIIKMLDKMYSNKK